MQESDVKEHVESREIDNESNAKDCVMESKEIDEKPGRSERANQEIEKYFKLIDFGGLAFALKSSDEQISQHGERLGQLERLIDKFPSVYVTADEVRESTERIDYLSKKLKKLLDSNERDQKVDQIKITGEINTLSASITNLDSRMSRCEAGTKSLTESVRSTRLELEKKASEEELRGVREQLEKYALKGDVVSLRNSIEHCAMKSEVDALHQKLLAVEVGGGPKIDKVEEKLQARVDELQTELVTLASKAELSKVESRATEAWNRTKQMKGTMEVISDQVEGFAEQVGFLQQSLEDRVGKEEFRTETEALQNQLASKFEEARGGHTRLSDQVQALSGTVSANATSIERFEAEIAQLSEGLSDRISSSDWEQIQSDLVDIFAKRDMIEPIVKKLNQVVAKLIDLDKMVASKAEGSIVVENREHIQDLYRIVSNLDNKNLPSSSMSSKNTNVEGKDMNVDDRTVSALQEKVKSQEVTIMNLQQEVRSLQANRELEDVVLQQRGEIQQLKDQLTDLRALVLQKHDNVLSLSDRPVVGNEYIPQKPTETRPDRPLMPFRQSSGQSIDKQNWDKQEKDRWLLETRAAQPTTPGTTTITELPKI